MLIVSVGVVAQQEDDLGFDYEVVNGQHILLPTWKNLVFMTSMPKEFRDEFLSSYQYDKETFETEEEGLVYVMFVKKLKETNSQFLITQGNQTNESRLNFAWTNYLMDITELTKQLSSCYVNTDEKDFKRYVIEEDNIKMFLGIRIEKDNKNGIIITRIIVK